LDARLIRDLGADYPGSLRLDENLSYNNLIKSGNQYVINFFQITAKTKAHQAAQKQAYLL
jgi:hypothetical protein